METVTSPLIDLVAPYTKTSRERRQAMIDALAKIDRDGVVGDIVECGVWRGGNIILARKLSPGRTCWLYDTFSGMTVPGPMDRKPSGRHALDVWNTKVAAGRPWCAASVQEVRDCLRDTCTLDDTKLRFIAGAVETTLLEAGNIPQQIALLRLDTDWHASTKIELEILFPRLVPGGILIVDDYGHWQGARRAVDDYFKNSVQWTWIDYSGVMMVKS